MKRSQFKKLLDIHGSDLRAWPAAERQEAEQLMRDDASSARLVANAAQLDAFIERGLSNLPGDDCIEDDALRVLRKLPQTLPSQGGFIQKAVRALRFSRPIETPLWPQAIALTLAAALGIAVGLWSASLEDLQDGKIVSVEEPEGDLTAVLFDTDTTAGPS